MIIIHPNVSPGDTQYFEMIRNKPGRDDYKKGGVDKLSGPHRESYVFGEWPKTGYFLLLT